MKLLDNEMCEIEYIKHIPCLYWKLKGSPSNETFKEFVLNGVDFFRKYKAKKSNICLLINAQAFDPEEETTIDIHWVNQCIMPQLYHKNGTQHIAFIPLYRTKLNELK